MQRHHPFRAATYRLQSPAKRVRLIAQKLPHTVVVMKHRAKRERNHRFGTLVQLSVDLLVGDGARTEPAHVAYPLVERCFSELCRGHI